MSSQETEAYVGIDWALEKHDVCVLGRDGRLMAERQVPHTPEGLEGLCDWLAARGTRVDAVQVAIEVPHGPVVEALLERGFAVFAINPKQLDRFRDRFSLAGAKDDRLDARVLADSLRTDGHRFRRLTPDAPEVIELREWSRMHDEVKAEVNRLANRARQQLGRYYYQLLNVGDITELWVLELFEKAPTPKAARTLRQDVIRRLLHRHRIRRTTAEDVRARLVARPLVVAEGTAEAAAAHVGHLVPRLRLAIQQRRECERELSKRVDALIPESDPSPGQPIEQHDVAILRSFAGLGRVTIAVLLAEASQPLANRDYHALRALSGQAPMTRRSGKQRFVLQRRACSARLRDALYHWCRVATQCDPHWRAIYVALRARGHRHGRALRTVGDRLLAALCAALRTGTLYDPERWRAPPEEVRAA